MDRICVESLSDDKYTTDCADKLINLRQIIPTMPRAMPFYHPLLVESLRSRRPRVLFISPVREHSGNRSTALRICEELRLVSGNIVTQALYYCPYLLYVHVFFLYLSSLVARCGARGFGPFQLSGRSHSSHRGLFRGYSFDCVFGVMICAVYFH